jgi:hypothetical protein
MYVIGDVRQMTSLAALSLSVATAKLTPEMLDTPVDQGNNISYLN